VGDTLFVDEPVTFPPIPSFSPEHFAVARAKDTSRYKQSGAGIEQLDHEGVVQVLRSDLRGDQARSWQRSVLCSSRSPSIGMAHEFNSPISLDRLGLLPGPSHGRRRPGRLPGNARSRCCHAVTVCYWPFSATDGACNPCSATFGTSCLPPSSYRCEPRVAAGNTLRSPCPRRWQTGELCADRHLGIRRAIGAGERT